MSKKKIVTCGVAFNLDDPDQLKLYEHAKKRTNFSAYIKRLITMDVLGIQAKQTTSTQQEEQKLDEVDFDNMKGFI